MVTFRAATRNLIGLVSDNPSRIFVYVFLFVNFVYGVTFTFFESSMAVQGGAFVLAHVPPIFWGVTCLTLTLLTLYAIASGSMRLTIAVGYLGVAVWGYALALYILVGLWFAALAIYLPQLLFWVIWGVGAYQYRLRRNLWGKPIQIK